LGTRMRALNIIQRSAQVTMFVWSSENSNYELL